MPVLAAIEVTACFTRGVPRAVVVSVQSRGSDRAAGRSETPGRLAIRNHVISGYVKARSRRVRSINVVQREKDGRAQRLAARIYRPMHLGFFAVPTL